MFAARIILFAVCAAVIYAAELPDKCSTGQRGLIVGMGAKHEDKLIKKQMETVVVPDKCASKGLLLVGVKVKACDTREAPIVHIQTLKTITVYRMANIRLTPARVSVLHYCALPSRAGVEAMEEESYY